MSLVYFYKNTENLKAGVNNFFEMISNEIKTDKVGFKIHFGEEKNNTHIDPNLLKDAKKYFRNPVFIECNVLYRGKRTFKKDHIETAKKHGFDFLDIDILDGEKGQENEEIEVNVGNTKKAKIGKGINKYSEIVALTHFKGHSLSGFGGAIKNIGMGLGSRAGKLDMHSSVCPVVDKDNCIGCNLCRNSCNFNAIQIEEGKAGIVKEKCAGCAMCIAVCPQGAINPPWGSDSTERLMEKMAEYATAVVKGRNMWYINFLTKITYGCDCANIMQRPLMDDIGILFSRDPVAIDTASLDLITRQRGKDPFRARNHINGGYIMEYSEKIGLGTMKYELEEI